ncbi:hypothetical protein [Streptomyces sp. WMMC940]|uniref:hypothetical protein n=1 Tax=Streptomyces sp. WMMC940 TaxID=3015153 RepID=UPI0022B6A63B|nr:hypothetical protein [Streptomyces sp. WMMC940]MCZ7461364.1 hypothetical protein [Streptomyces sp. WMMC940]
MDDVLCGLAANPALPPELVDRLIAVADDDLARALTDRVDLSHPQALALALRHEGAAAGLAREGRLTAADIDPVVWPDAALALLENGAGGPEWARLLVGDPDVLRRERLAACPGLPPDVVDRLAVDPEVRVVAELALWAPPDLAARLAFHPHTEVRGAVAANERTPPGTLAMLVTGEGVPPARWCQVCEREATPFVHHSNCPRPTCHLWPGAACDGTHQTAVHGMYEQALGNPATPVGVAAGFARHPSMPLRLRLAARPDLTPGLWRQLSADPTPGVRAELAGNPALDETQIRVLAADRDPEVRRRLAFHPRVPLDVLGPLADTARIGSTLPPRIAAATPTEVDELARSPHPAVRMLLAERRDLPATVRDLLAADPDAKVLKSIAGHPGLSERQLRAMVDRHGARVIARVAGNPDASPALLEDLVRHDPPIQRVLREVAAHGAATPPALLGCLADGRGRRAAAGNPALPPRSLAGLLDDDDWLVVRAAAANPSLPLAVMTRFVP